MHLEPDCPQMLVVFHNLFLFLVIQNVNRLPMMLII